VFIAFMRGETNQGPNHDQDAKAIFDSILVAAKAGAFPREEASVRGFPHANGVNFWRVCLAGRDSSLQPIRLLWMLTPN
jgi:hypothetical protein